MKLLYGSQNFGYDTKDSDKDWLEFVYPCWEEIIKNEITNKELHNDDGSITKVKDIRLIPKMIKKANFNDLQVLFSQETYECEDLKWFIEHRQELIRANMWQLFCSNVGYIKSQLKENTNKSIIRAYCFTRLLEGVLNYPNAFLMRLEYLGKFRMYTDKKFFNELKKYINVAIVELENDYCKYKHMKNDILINEMYLEIERLVKKKLC